MSSGNEVDIHEELAGAAVTPLHKTLGVLITLITLIAIWQTRRCAPPCKLKALGVG